jgi:hypothetical protein
MYDEPRTVRLYDRRFRNNLEPIGFLLCFGTPRTPISIVGMDCKGTFVGVWKNDSLTGGNTYILPSNEWYSEGNSLKEIILSSNKSVLDDCY